MERPVTVDDWIEIEAQDSEDFDVFLERYFAGQVEGCAE